MKFITTMPRTSDEFRALVQAECGIDSVPMESSCERVGHDSLRVVFGFMANESKGETFTKHKGYSMKFAANEVYATNFDGDRLYELSRFDVWPNEIWDKTIRTHEEVKNELDRLYAEATYDERFVLRRLYEFMQEGYPVD